MSIAIEEFPGCGYSQVPAGRFARSTQPFEAISAPLA